MYNEMTQKEARDRYFQIFIELLRHHLILKKGRPTQYELDGICEDAFNISGEVNSCAESFAVTQVKLRPHKLSRRAS